GAMPLYSLVRQRQAWLGAAAFALLCIAPSLLNPHSNGFTGDGDFLASFTGLDIGALLAAPARILSLQLFSEPALLGLFFLGLGLLAFKRPPLFYFMAAFFFSYAAAFYFFFRLEARFMLPLVIFYALAGGYAFGHFSRRKAALAVLCALLLIPLGSSLRLAALELQGDTRANARAWALEHIPQGGKVLVDVPLMRLSTDKGAVEELRAIDPGAVRRADEADAHLSEAGKRTLHALNLFTAPDASLPDLSAYAEAHGYEYVIYSPNDDSQSQGRRAALDALARQGALAASWDGMKGFSVTGSAFYGPLTELFSGKPLGSDVRIYRLDRD
ncbi:MAG TPA: hypothetical protein VHD37_01720, partial [Candidatus Paceibacterota bacterium]|nr:hypothetical protein [Candidatus Paceibacterota bacterium]